MQRVLDRDPGLLDPPGHRFRVRRVNKERLSNTVSAVGEVLDERGELL